MTYKTYADVFWGGDLKSCDGYEALLKRNQETKKTLQEFEDFLKKRSKIEAEYSKSLQNLAKSFLKQREETGVIEATLNKIKFELEVVAQSHQGASNFYQQQSDTVKKFKEEQGAKRKVLEESLSKAQNSKIAQFKRTLQLEKSYVRRYIERDAAEQSLREMNTTSTALPKDIEKAKNKVTKAEEEAEKADSAYKIAIKVLDDCRISWEREMISACKCIQEHDEEKIRFLRRELWLMVNLVSKVALDTDNSSEAVRDILEKCDVVSDIQAFIDMAKTGEDKPERFVFKHYKLQTSGDNDSNSSDSPFHVYCSAEDLEEIPESEAESPSPSNKFAKAAFGRAKIPKKKENTS